METLEINPSVNSQTQKVSVSSHLFTDGKGRVLDTHLRGENEHLGLAEDVTGHGSGLHHLGLLRVAPA